MGDAWSTETVLALAPDASAERAGRGLATPKAFSSAGSDGQTLWGLAAGSGQHPYQVVVDVSGPPSSIGYKCTCPSRKFPCKHVLGLTLLWSAGQLPPSAEPADFAAVWWQERQRKAAAADQRRSERPDVSTASVTGGDDASPERTGPDDDDKADDTTPAAAGAAARKRAGRVAAGLNDLERWLGDQVRTGLAGTPAKGRQHFERVAARMVDAQVPGVAARLRELPAVVGSASSGTSPSWPARLLEEYGLLRLLVVAQRRTADPGGGNAIGPDMAATISNHLGFTRTAAEVLAGPPVRDDWVLEGIREVAESKLSSRRYFLRGNNTGRWALVLQFRVGGGAWTGVAPTAALGSTMAANLHFYPGSSPLRAQIGDVFSGGAAAEPVAHPIVDARRAFAAVLALDPWIRQWPCVLQATPVRGARGWLLVDAAGAAVPVRLEGVDPWLLTAAAGGRPSPVMVEWTPDGVIPVSVRSLDGMVRL